MDICYYFVFPFLIAIIAAHLNRVEAVFVFLRLPCFTAVISLCKLTYTLV